jgi:hypothetical protein
MSNKIRIQRPALHTLIPLEDFKALLGVDDREDTLSRYGLVTATYSIEQYCLRRLFLKRHFERIEFTGDLLLPLREYPVREVLAVYVINNEQGTVKHPRQIRGLVFVNRSKRFLLFGFLSLPFSPSGFVPLPYPA